MKTFIASLIFSMLGYVAIAQSTVPCYIKYTYDNAGNRIKREYVCQTDPYDSGTTTTSGNGTGLAQAFNNTTDTEETITEENFILVFPNPTKGEFWVRFNQPIPNSKIRILDQNGKILLVTEGGEGEVYIDLRNYADGQYYVVVNDGKKNISKKINKVR